MKIRMSWDELVNSYDDDGQSFERFICDELGINPTGCFEQTPEGEITTDEAFGILDRMYSGRTFKVTPKDDYIRWRGRLTRDFRVAVTGGWKNPASAANGRRGGRPKKAL